MKKFIGKLLLVIVLLILICAVALTGLGYKEYKSSINETSITTKVNELRAKNNYVTLDNISVNMQNAMVAIEDKRFYSHGAFDLYSLCRAVVVSYVQQTGKQGGSTLTQQLAKNFYYLNNSNGVRKISEAFIAQDIENNYTKKEVLEMYLNIVYFGDDHYGIYEAAKGYFNVLPSQLDVAQAAMIAGMPQAPSIYALSNNNKISYDRQHQVLKCMLDQGYINNNEYQAAVNEKIE